LRRLPAALFSFDGGPFLYWSMGVIGELTAPCPVQEAPDFLGWQIIPPVDIDDTEPSALTPAPAGYGTPSNAFEPTVKRL
jgi:hypothetical protein